MKNLYTLTCLIISLGIATSCQEKISNDPYNSNCPKELFTPNNLSASQVEGTIILNWTMSTDNISGFKIFRNENDGVFSEVGNLPSNIKTWIHSSPKPGVKNGYKLIAFAGNNFSNDVFVYKTIYSTSSITTNGLITNITSTSVTTGGEVLSDGGSAVTTRGVCYSTNPNPTIADSKTNDGSGLGVFVSNLTGLNVATTYYVRAYAINGIGTSYGNQISFTTSTTYPTVSTINISNITSNSANCGGNILNDGGSPIISKGVCWNTSQNPTISNNKTNDGYGAGSFSSSITGLIPGTIYYVRAYAINNIGISYGTQMEFASLAILPTVTTNSISVINLNTAYGGGTIISDGGSPITSRGLCWSTSQNPTINDNKTIDGTGLGPFNSLMTGLLSNRSYYVKAYATNALGTSYGSNIYFLSSLSIPSNGLLAFYPFNGNAKDESEHILNGIVNGATLTSDRFGNDNSAYLFVNNQYITIPNTGKMNIYPLTISLWYRVEYISNIGAFFLFRKYVSGAWNGFQIAISYYENEYQTNPWYIRSTTDRLLGFYGESSFNQMNISFNRWYHFVFVADNSGGKLFVNGILVDSHNWTGVPGASNNDYLWQIGGIESATCAIKIDDVLIYNRALNSSEVLSLYNSY